MANYVIYSTPDKVDATMASIQEQREIANEISDAISNPMNAGIDLDEVHELMLLICSNVLMYSCLIYRMSLRESQSRK